MGVDKRGGPGGGEVRSLITEFEIVKRRVEKYREKGRR